MNALLDSPHLFGFCYTQLTDVEQEQNGLYTYDRKAKFDVERLRKITSRAAAIESDTPVEPEPSVREWQVLVGAVPDGELAREWRYTVEQPADKNWTKPDFDDSSWLTGLGGFGTKGGWEWATRTPWNTKDVWLRQEFTYDGEAFDHALLVAHYDNKTVVYVNGKRVWHGTGWNDRYCGFSVTKSLKGALKPGRNVIAVHTHQDEGGQFIDVALLLGSRK